MHGRVSVIKNGKVVWSDDDCEIIFPKKTKIERQLQDELSLISEYFQPKPDELRHELMGNTIKVHAETAKEPWYLGAIRGHKKRL